MTIMKRFRSHHVLLVGYTLGFLAVSVSAFAAPPAQPGSTPGIYRVITPPPGSETCDYLSGWSQGLPSVPTPPPNARPRLTVADFMGTWKVYAKCGESFPPSMNIVNEKTIGKTVIFSRESTVDNTYPYLVMAHKITKNPVYKVKYKKLEPNTLYPDLPGTDIQYEYFPAPNYMLLFKVGYYSKIEKKVTYTLFQVGSNDKSLPFALTLGGGDTVFYLCKVNPKTGDCQDHP